MRPAPGLCLLTGAGPRAVRPRGSPLTPGHTRAARRRSLQAALGRHAAPSTTSRSARARGGWDRLRADGHTYAAPPAALGFCTRPAGPHAAAHGDGGARARGDGCRPSARPAYVTPRTCQRALSFASLVTLCAAGALAPRRSRRLAGGLRDGMVAGRQSRPYRAPAPPPRRLCRAAGGGALADILRATACVVLAAPRNGRRGACGRQCRRRRESTLRRSFIHQRIFSPYPLLLRTTASRRVHMSTAASKSIAAGPPRSYWP